MCVVLHLWNRNKTGCPLFDVLRKLVSDATNNDVGGKVINKDFVSFETGMRDKFKGKKNKRNENGI